jgi:hypothetical protein
MSTTTQCPHCTQTVHGAATPSYIAVLDAAGDLVAGIADTSVLSDSDTLWKLTHEVSDCLYPGPEPDSEPDEWSIEEFYTPEVNYEVPAVLVLDGNIGAKAFSSAVQDAVDASTAVLFEPTSVQKALLPVEQGVLRHITIITPNLEVSICIQLV